MNSFKQKHIILASQSPRRKELLEQMGLEITIQPAHIDETIPKGLSPEKAVVHLAEKKAHALAANHPESWIISADTIVVVDNTILGKPRAPTHAVEMITHLSGRDHHVFTGFTVGCGGKKITQSHVVKTRVRFKALSAQEIQWYANTPEPYDKAGGYGIQGIGTFLVKEIQGSYSNVVGLPMCELMQTLLNLNVIAI